MSDVNWFVSSDNEPKTTPDLPRIVFTYYGGNDMFMPLLIDCRTGKQIMYQTLGFNNYRYGDTTLSGHVIYLSPDTDEIDTFFAVFDLQVEGKTTS